MASELAKQLQSLVWMTIGPQIVNLNVKKSFWRLKLANIDYSTVWHFSHPMVTNWSTMAAKVQMEQVEQLWR